MSDSYRRNVVEAALLAAGKSVQLGELAQVFAESERPTEVELVAILESLQSEYAPRALELAPHGQRLASAGAGRLRRGGLAVVARATGTVFASAARNSGADCLSAADHARGDRAGARGSP